MMLKDYLPDTSLSEYTQGRCACGLSVYVHRQTCSLAKWTQALSSILGKQGWDVSVWSCISYILYSTMHCLYNRQMIISLRLLAESLCQALICSVSVVFEQPLHIIPQVLVQSQAVFRLWGEVQPTAALAPAPSQLCRPLHLLTSRTTPSAGSKWIGWIRMACVLGKVAEVRYGKLLPWEVQVKATAVAPHTCRMAAIKKRGQWVLGRMWWQASPPHCWWECQSVQTEDNMEVPQQMNSWSTI